MSYKIIECPRDAMQGLHEFVPTEKKIAYINQLLTVGYDTIDFGSFVSPKAIPQMQDTAEVLGNLDLTNTKSKLLAIVANIRGAEEAMKYNEIRYIGFPFSVSETFQQRNTNSSIAQSLITVVEIQNLCVRHGKELVVYISMGFGNPYGDVWNVEIVEKWVKEMDKIGVKILSLSDTLGIANPESISYLFKNLIPAFKHIEFGAHLHTTPITWEEKIAAAFANGCKRFDGAIKGYGGCPMAADELTGNMPTENIISFFDEKGIDLGIDKQAFRKAMFASLNVFGV
jgi:hydroxymethylglutaryl-CoA lyase